MLQTKGTWINIGVWQRGPISLPEIEARISVALKK